MTCIIKIISNKGGYVKNHTFLSKFDIEKTVDMLFKCSPAQLQEFRGIMFAVYRNANGHDFLEDDVIAMKELKDKVSERINESDKGMDKIALQQYRWIIENIDEFISNLSSNGSF